MTETEFLAFFKDKKYSIIEGEFTKAVYCNGLFYSFPPWCKVYAAIIGKDGKMITFKTLGE